MENHEQDTAPLRAGSEETLGQVVPRGAGSNSRAFKVAGLTVLACLLLSSQALMAYMVFSHRAQIDSLQASADKMLKLSSRPPAAPAMPMRLPMMTMPLGDFMMGAPPKGAPPKGAPPKKTPLVNLQNIAMMTLERQVKDLLQDFHLPQFNETFQANLKSLKTQMEEDEWEGLETWMRHWLIFQTAQQTPRTSESATSLQTKCNLLRQQASTGSTSIGAYQPQCDGQGRYEPMQCWHSTGFCWCVDADGNVIPETMIRGRPSCGGAQYRAPDASIMAHPNMRLMEPLPTDE